MFLRDIIQRAVHSICIPVLVCGVLLLFALQSAPPQRAVASPQVQVLNEGQGHGFSYKRIRIEARDGGPSDARVLINIDFPTNAATVMPICAINSYWTEGEEDIGWMCGEEPTLHTGNPPILSSAEILADVYYGDRGYVELTVILLDTEVFNVDVYDTFVLTDSAPSYTASVPLTEISGVPTVNQAIPVVTINRYDTAADDDFSFGMSLISETPGAITVLGSAFEGDEDSSVAVTIYRIEPMAPCGLIVPKCWATRNLYSDTASPGTETTGVLTSDETFIFESLISYLARGQDALSVHEVSGIDGSSIVYTTADDHNDADEPGNAEWQRVILNITADAVPIPFEIEGETVSAGDGSSGPGAPVECQPFAFEPVTVQVSGPTDYVITGTAPAPEGTEAGKGILVVDDTSGATGFALHVAGNETPVGYWTGSGNFPLAPGDYEIRTGQGVVGRASVGSGTSTTLQLATGRLELTDPGPVGWAIRQAGTETPFGYWTGDFSAGYAVGDYEILSQNKVIASFNIRRGVTTQLQLPTGHISISDPGVIGWAIRETGSEVMLGYWTGDGEFGYATGSYDIVAQNRVIACFGLAIGETLPVPLPTGRIAVTATTGWAIHEAGNDAALGFWTGSGEFGYVVGEYEFRVGSDVVARVTVQRGQTVPVSLP